MLTLLEWSQLRAQTLASIERIFDVARVVIDGALADDLRAQAALIPVREYARTLAAELADLERSALSYGEQVDLALGTSHFASEGN